MNHPKKNLHNTTFSVQLPYIAGHSLSCRLPVPQFSDFHCTIGSSSTELNLNLPILKLLICFRSLKIS